SYHSTPSVVQASSRGAWGEKRGAWGEKRGAWGNAARHFLWALASLCARLGRLQRLRTVKWATRPPVLAHQLASAYENPDAETLHPGSGPHGVHPQSDGVSAARLPART